LANFDLKAILTAEDRASSTISKVGGAFSNLAKVGLAAATAGAIGLGYELVKCAKAAGESEFADRKMTEMLKNSGKVTEEQIGRLRKYAETMQFKLGIDDENIKQGIAMLGTFKLQGDTIEKTIPILGALANAYKQSTGEAVSLQDWAIKIGKAEALPELATMLRRIGIVFDENQLSMLKAANEEERVRIITTELIAEFGNGTWVAEGFSGKMLILGLMFDEVKEKIGAAIITALLPWMQKLTEWAMSDQTAAKIQEISDKLGAFATMAVPIAIGVIQNQLLPALRVVWGTINWLKDAWETTWGKAMIVSIFLLVAGLAAASGSIGLIAGTIAYTAWAVYASWREVVGLLGDLWNLTIGKIDSLRVSFIRLRIAISDAAEALRDFVRNKIEGIIGGVLGRQHGGPVSGGSPYIVGEAGPELFVPSSSGRVIPNNQISNSISVNFTGNITNTSNASLDAIGERIGRSIQLNMQGF